jgi:hypothetical protein
VPSRVDHVKLGLLGANTWTPVHVRRLCTLCTVDAPPSSQEHLGALWEATRGCHVFVATYPQSNASAHLLASGGQPGPSGDAAAAQTQTAAERAQAAAAAAGPDQRARAGRVLLVSPRDARTLQRGAGVSVPASFPASFTSSSSPLGKAVPPSPVSAAGSSLLGADSSSTKNFPAALHQWLLLHAALRAFRVQLEHLDASASRQRSGHGGKSPSGGAPGGGVGSSGGGSGGGGGLTIVRTRTDLVVPGGFGYGSLRGSPNVVSFDRRLSTTSLATYACR